MKIKIGRSYVDSTGEISYIKEKHPSIERYFNSSGNETFDEDGRNVLEEYYLVKEYFDPRLKKCIQLLRISMLLIGKASDKGIFVERFVGDIEKTLKEIGE